MENNKRTLQFHVNGMHCHACEVLTESELSDLPEVAKAKADLASLTVQVEGEFGGRSEEEIAKYLSEPMLKHGYSISVERTSKDKRWRDFRIALPVALGFAALFVLLQKAGIVNLVDATEMSYGTIFFIGIIASLSTCMAVVGGLLLSISATFAKEGDKIRPQMLFHIGRIVSFFILGGVIGVIGSAFQLNATMTMILNLLIGAVMVILGLNLMDLFHFTKKLQPAMPKFIGRHAVGISKMNHRLTPLFAGIITFFLPCGFTQSMQIYTLSTGSFTSGAMTMLVYALGTLPVLAILSFSSLSIPDSKRSVFFKTVGLIVIMFALLNIVSGLVVAGIIPPILNI